MPLLGTAVKIACRGISEISCESRVELYDGAGEGIFSKSIKAIIMVLAY